MLATVGVLCFLPLFYGLAARAIPVVVGTDQVVDVARDSELGLPFVVLDRAYGSGPARRVATLRHCRPVALGSDGGVPALGRAMCGLTEEMSKLTPDPYPLALSTFWLGLVDFHEPSGAPDLANAQEYVDRVLQFVDYYAQFPLARRRVSEDGVRAAIQSLNRQV
ncbi:hypothetical protein [Dactylosporangium darangshiense]|uniref:Uncharacterized protein n=1 Tax=Dactylosporangium darangshiense TaxID=579108 RepID=A0ABP8DW25_9ACTN